MATIDLKLKTYDELQFEIMNLTTKNYLQQQELDKYKNIVEEIQNIYISMQFSAPENMYVFIDRLGEILEELKGDDE